MLIRCVISSAVIMAASLFAMPTHSYGHDNKWEPIEKVDDEVKKISKHENLEVFSAPNVIMVTVDTPMKIEIFTILGRLVVSQHLQPGSYEFKINTHGVYLVKTEGSTSKVAI